MLEASRVSWVQKPEVSSVGWVLRRRKRAAGSAWAGQLTAPLALGGMELLPALAKLGGALTVR